MTKKKKESSGGMPLLEYLEKVEAATRQTREGIRPGSMAIDVELKAAISEDIKRAMDASGRELSRYEVAARMSEMVGEEITKTTLDNWCAPSHPHHMSVRYLPALVHATGGRRTFECLSHHSGLFALPGEDAVRAEMSRIKEQIAALSEQVTIREALLKRMHE